eukprot:SM002378S07721  [mRNA]  locus=s2378:1357:1623:- [translate_table: standard]
MIGGVLVERTVGEVLPAVRRNAAGLSEVLARLGENLTTRKAELAGLEAQYKIRVRRAGEAPADEEDDAGSAGRREGSSQGVLVGTAGA